MRMPPLIDDYAALEAGVAEPPAALLEVEVLDLDALTQQIDDASVPVLAPPERPTSPTESRDELRVGPRLLRLVGSGDVAAAARPASAAVGVQDRLLMTGPASAICQPRAPSRR